MHRNYQPVKPATNKLLKKRWDGAAHDRHRDKIMQAKPIVDTKSPSTYMHLQYKMKKIQLEEERHAVIDRDNRILLEKMSAIMRTRGRVDNWNDYVPKSLNKHKRTRELIRVTLENQKILARIQAKQPQYSAKKWEEEWMDTQKYMGHIRKYSDDWYQQAMAEKRKSSSRISKRGSISKDVSGQERRQETAVSTQQYSDEEGEITKPPSAGPPKSAKSAKSATSAKSAPKSASPKPPVAAIEKPLTPVLPVPQTIVDEKPPTPKPATPQPAEPEVAKPDTPQPAEAPKAATPENPAVVKVPDPEVPDLDGM